jgi:hypothetical protein
MTVRPALPWLLLVLGCTRSTELLPPGDDASIDRPVPADVYVPADRDAPADSFVPDTGPPRRHYPFCPTTIDVYGGTNFLFPVVGGPQSPMADPKAGLVGSENQGYDQTLAGRLAARLEDDADVVPALGSTWTVRSCAGMGETLSQLSPPLDADACGRNSPFRDDRYLNACSQNPAPVLLIAASMLDDRCHGGGPDSDALDDPATYQDHYHQRLNAFLGSRTPHFALVGTRTEWTDVSSPFTMSSCRWTRPDWERDALALWKDRPLGIEVESVGDLNDQFKHHHRCCRELDPGPCGSNWFDRWMSDAVNADGAQQIVNLWYDALKHWLLSSDFDCP